MYIPTDRNLQLEVILFADDLALLASTEHDVKRSVYNFHIVASECNAGISVVKSKVLEIRGKKQYQLRPV
jgi:hypothetical protein